MTLLYLSISASRWHDINDPKRRVSRCVIARVYPHNPKVRWLKYDLYHTPIQHERAASFTVYEDRFGNQSGIHLDLPQLIEDLQIVWAWFAEALVAPIVTYKERSEEPALSHVIQAARERAL